MLQKQAVWGDNMHFKPVPFYSKAIFQKIFFSRDRRVMLSFKPLVQLIITKEKSSDLPAISNVRVAAFTENLPFIGIKARMKLLNYLYNEGTSQYQRKYVIDKIAEQDMAGLAKQGASKVIDAIIIAALGLKADNVENDHILNSVLHYPFFWFSQQDGFLANRDYQCVLIAASKYVLGELPDLAALGAYHEQAQKEKIFRALSHCLGVGGPASFKELATVYTQHSNDKKGLVEFSDLVLLISSKEEMHTKTNQWWMQYCKE
jgi:hypothetical protein